MRHSRGWIQRLLSARYHITPKVVQEPNFFNYIIVMPPATFRDVR